MRTIILHYHLFKNAGTSVDGILKSNFPSQWVTAEFPHVNGNNSQLVADWIQSEPDAVVFSSHTAMGPVPRIENTRVISLLFLRDPLDRIRSAYEFERKQQVDTLGSRLARDNSLEQYVRKRLAIEGDRQCLNFQTWRLSRFDNGEETERNRALSALSEVSFCGLVEFFDLSMQKFGDLVKSYWPHFAATEEHLNSNRKKERMDDALVQLILENNMDDLFLVRALKERSFP